jgi:hypothetical protein
VLHKPNFCSECGEKIDKENRKWWESLRFCGNCAGQYDKLATRIFKYFAGAIIFAGFGFIIANSIPPRKQPVVSNQNQAVANPQQQIVNRQTAQTNQNSNPPQNAKTGNQAAVQNPPQALIASPAQSVPTIPYETETAYFCGARTQKGAPCSRRVRGGGRCWQHVGKPAMLPPEKLKITQ